MKKLLLTLLFVAGYNMLSADDIVNPDFQNFLRSIKECKDTTLAQNSKVIHFGFEFARTDTMSDEEWETTVHRIADIMLNNASGDFGAMTTIVTQSMEFARTDMPSTTGFSYQIGFIDPSEQTTQAPA